MDDHEDDYPAEMDVTCLGTILSRVGSILNLITRITVTSLTITSLEPFCRSLENGV